MQEHKSEKIIVYLLTCACVDFFEAALPQLPELKGVRLHALHGRMKQALRESTMQAYTTQPAGMLCKLYDDCRCPHAEGRAEGSNGICILTVATAAMVWKYAYNFSVARC